LSRSGSIFSRKTPPQNPEQFKPTGFHLGKGGNNYDPPE